MNDSHLFRILKRAIDAYAAPDQLSGSVTIAQLGYWRGQQSLFDFADSIATVDPTELDNRAPGCVVIVEFAKWSLSNQGTDQAIKLLLEQGERLFSPGVANSVKLKLPRALTGMALAVVYLKLSKPNYRRAYELLFESARNYDSLWPIGQPITPHSGNIQSPSQGFDFDPNVSPDEQADSILNWICRCCPLSISKSTWLTMHFLLTYLLDVDPVAGPPAEPHDQDDSEPSTPQDTIESSAKPIEPASAIGPTDQVFINRATAITVRGNPNDRVAIALPVSFHASGHRHADGIYLDPLSFGVTRFDSVMANSLQLAWQYAKQTDTKYHQIRIEIEPPELCESLFGPSAGGLLAAGSVATLKERYLDRGRTTSCGLTMRPSEQGPIFELTDVGEIELKAIGLWTEHQFRDFFLTKPNADKWSAVHPNASLVSSVGSLPELIAGLTQDMDYELHLASYANLTHRFWPDVEAAILADESHRQKHHRFDCYVGPNFYVEGPMQIRTDKNQPTSDGRRTDRSGKPTVNEQVQRESVAVPGTSTHDQQLIHLASLILAPESRPWPDKPNWLKPGRDLVIYDNAGAGKTVCSFRLQNILTSPQVSNLLFGKSRFPLVIRIEGDWPVDSDRQPLSIRQVMVDKLAKTPGLDDPQKRELVHSIASYALKQKRVVLIVDGLDQFVESELRHIVDQFRRDPDRESIKWIILGRVHIIDRLRSAGSLFDDENWTRARIEPFNEQQQDEYFDLPKKLPPGQKRIGSRWLDTILGREQMKDLLGLPVVLDQIRGLIELADLNQQELPVFRNLSELYLLTSRSMLSRAIEKSERSVLSQLDEPPDHLKDPAEKINLLEHVLCLMAFQMMLLEEYNGKRRADQIDQFIQLCRNRFQQSLKSEYLNMDEVDLEFSGIKGKIARQRREWDWAILMLKTVELHHRSVTDSFHDQGIAFRNRKMVECHAARFLTRYATRHDIYAGDDDQVASDLTIINPQHSIQDPDVAGRLCAWNYTSHPQWKQTWELAIEMPQQPISNTNPSGQMTGALLDPGVTVNSLSALFRVPKPYPGQDRGMRPTELIFKAWHLFEFDGGCVDPHYFQVELPNAEKKKQWMTGRQIREDDRLGPKVLESLARPLVLGNREMDSPEIASIRKETIETVYRDSASKALVAEFETRMDTVLIGDGERVQLPADPSERQEILEKWRQQSSFEKSHTFLQCPPKSMVELDPDCLTNDAIKILKGASIRPTMMQSTTVTRGQFRQFNPHFEKSESIAHSINEYASAFEPDHQKDDFPIIEVNWFDAWCHCKWLGYGYRLPNEAEWEFACRGGTTTEFHFGDILDGSQANFNGHPPYGIDDDDIKKIITEMIKPAPLPFLGRVAPVGDPGYPLNPWGLYDVHGNVMEWCQSWFGSHIFRFSRVLRGGSWSFSAIYCRSSYRFFYEPSNRNYYLGFRVCCDC